MPSWAGDPARPTRDRRPGGVFGRSEPAAPAPGVASGCASRRRTHRLPRRGVARRGSGRLPDHRLLRLRRGDPVRGRAGQAVPDLPAADVGPRRPAPPPRRDRLLAAEARGAPRGGPGPPDGPGRDRRGDGRRRHHQPRGHLHRPGHHGQGRRRADPPLRARRPRRPPLRGAVGGGRPAPPGPPHRRTAAGRRRLTGPAAPTPEAHRFATACLATPHYLATHAGAAVLRQGGNAMDAAIAANLVLGVVAPYTCGIGGDCFALVWDGRLHGYNGSGRAPAVATPDALLERIGHYSPAAAGIGAALPPADGTNASAPAMPRHGPLPMTVPGAVDAWFALLERFGTQSFATLAEAAIAYAVGGFPLTSAGAARIRAGRPADSNWGDWDAVYGRATVGVRLCQPDLARTLEALAAGGPEAFYRGEIGAAVADHVQRLGGLLDAGDLAAHRGEWVEPLEGRYRDVTVAELP